MSMNDYDYEGLAELTLYLFYFFLIAAFTAGLICFLSASEAHSQVLPLQQAYVWQDKRGITYVGALKNVAPECLQGMDKVKGWSHGLVRKPKLGDKQ